MEMLARSLLNNEFSALHLLILLNFNSDLVNLFLRASVSWLNFNISNVAYWNLIQVNFCIHPTHNHSSVRQRPWFQPKLCAHVVMQDSLCPKLNDRGQLTSAALTLNQNIVRIFWVVESQGSEQISEHKTLDYGNPLWGWEGDKRC